MNNEIATLVIKFVGNIQEITKDVQKLKQGLNGLNKTKVDGSGIKDFVKQTKSGSSQVRNEVNKTKASIESLGGAFKKIGRIGKFLMFTYVGRQLASFTAGLITSGANLTEIENLFQVSFGNMASRAEEFAKTLERAWGINAVVTKEQTSYLNNMYKALGFTEEGAYGLSTGLVQLSYNMASLFNKDQVQILNALRSATIGLSRPIKQFGIETGVASLQEVALRKGIISTAREMTRQEKVLATYWAIYEQTESAWKSGTAVVDGQTVAIGDMTKTIMSNANMMRVIKDQLKSISYWWGLGFQPIVNFVLPVLYKLMHGLVQLGKTFSLFIGKLFGFSSLEQMIGDFGTAGAGTMEDVEDGLGEVGNEADKTKKKIKNLISGFDELNVRAEETGGASFGGIGGGIENDIGLPSMDELLGDSILDQVNAKLKETFGFMEKYLAPLREIKFDNLIASLKTLGFYLGMIGRKAWAGLEWAYFNLLVPLTKWSIELFIPKFIDLISASLGLLNSVILAIAPSLKTFWDSFGKGALGGLGEGIIATLDLFIQKIKELTVWIRKNPEQFKAFATALGSIAIGFMAFKGLTGVFNVFKNLSTVGGSLTGVLSSFKLFENTLTNIFTRVLPNAIAMIGQGGLAGALQYLAGAFSFLVSPITLVVAFVGALVAGFMYLMATSEEFRNNIAEKIGGIVAIFTDTFQKIMDGFITPFINAVIEFVKKVWDGGFNVLVENISYFVLALIEVIGVWVNWFATYVLPTVMSVIAIMLTVFGDLFAGISSVVASIFKIFNGLITFIIGVFTGDWKKAWEGIKTIFSGIWEAMSSIVKSICNVIIGIVEGLVNFVLSGLNLMIKGLNSLKIDVPKWVPVIGGQSLGFNITEFQKVSLPRLADGGIVSSPTVVEVGEYAGARNNPEVIAPLNDLKGYIGANSSQRELQLMEEQNELLRRILLKPSGITQSDIEEISFDYMKKETKRTGDLLFG